jgi:hypothetical protein
VFGSFLPKNFFRVVRFEIGWYQNDRKPKWRWVFLTHR